MPVNKKIEPNRLLKIGEIESFESRNSSTELVRPNDGEILKCCNSCEELLEKDELVCDSCGASQELKLRYKPRWWGIIVGLFILISSYVILKGVLSTLAYTFAITIIVLALLPASVSPALVRCKNCRELFQEKLGLCPRCKQQP